MENSVLKQHVEYFIEMEKEQILLNEEYNQLKKEENHLQLQIEQSQKENDLSEAKTNALTLNVSSSPEK